MICFSTFYLIDIIFFRLINDTAKSQLLKLNYIFAIWYNAIKASEGQNRLMRSIKRTRMKRQKLYKTFLDKISRELDQTSESHAEAFDYWIRTGNLVHIDSSYDLYPNVSLTCLHPNLDFGRNL